LGLARTLGASPARGGPVGGPGRDGGGDRVGAPGRRGALWVRRIDARLVRGGSPFGLGVVAGGSCAVALVVAGLGWRLTGTALVLPLALGLAGVAGAAVIRAGAARAASRLAAQLPQVTQSLAASVGAGLSLSRALERAAADAPEPLAGELAATVQEIGLGARVDEALELLATRVGSRDLRVLVTAIIVQRRTGGDLARALSQLAERLDERRRLERELRGVTAQARLTAWMVAALPAAAGVMAELAAPGMLRHALGDGVGPLLLVVCLALYGVGVVLVRRIGRVAL
ncbi:MAG: type II secretion system F family protein, partial [Miltoncostaeaceae bacterium]